MLTEQAKAHRAPATRRKGTALRKTLRKPQFWFGLTVLVPLWAHYIWFALVPIGRALFMAVFDYNLLNPAESNFVGLKHFQMLYSYSLFWPALRNTLSYAALHFLFLVPTGLFVSICLASLTRGRGAYQFAIFLPVVVSYVAVALLFRMLMDPEIGQFNAILRALHLPTSRFLTGPKSALVSIAAVDGWKGLGLTVVLLTAGILNIPEDMYDAAKVDGAGPWARMRHVTIPLLANTIALVSVTNIMGGLQAFTQQAVLGSVGNPGGPGTSTYVLNLFVYLEAFENLRFGPATAAAFTLFLMILVLTLFQLKVLRPKWTY